MLGESGRVETWWVRCDRRWVVERAELAEDDSLRAFEGGLDDGPTRFVFLLLPMLDVRAACVVRGVAVSSDEIETADDDDCEI